MCRLVRLDFRDPLGDWYLTIRLSPETLELIAHADKTHTKEIVKTDVVTPNLI